MRKLSKNLMILLLGVFTLFIFAHAELDNDSDPIEADNNALIGRWIPDGAAIKEYPVCYQLWKCESGKPMTGESITLPKGEWGLCENYADLSSNNICTKCDAPPPIEVCE